MPVIEEFDPSLEAFDSDQMFERAPAPVVAKRVSLSPQEALVRTAKLFVPIGAGLLLIWFGLTSTGSYFISATKFGGFLAGLFYGWQFGTLLAMVGIVLIYDAIKRSGYL